MNFNEILIFPGIVGEADDTTGDFFLWTHKKLEIGYNKNQIVDINLTSDNKVKLEPNKNIQFTYEVRFVGAAYCYVLRSMCSLSLQDLYFSKEQSC